MMDFHEIKIAEALPKAGYMIIPDSLAETLIGFEEKKHLYLPSGVAYQIENIRDFMVDCKMKFARVYYR